MYLITLALVDDRNEHFRYRVIHTLHIADTVRMPETGGLRTPRS